MQDLSTFTNTELKKIINVYQLDYTNGKSSGLGDFLRGCFFLAQLTSFLNIEFDIDISNHQINKYIEQEKNPALDYNNISRFYLTSIDKFMIENKDDLNKIIQELNTKKVEILALFTNCYPIYDKYESNIVDIIKNKLIPNNDMLSYIISSLKYLELNKNEYATIHIRLGDKYLVNNSSIKKKFLQKIKNFLLTKVNFHKKYLIVSDSIILKNFLKDIPFFYILNTNITHLGGEGMKIIDYDSIRNTLLDFYLMGYSNYIISLSVYEQGSGFSKYCSVLNNIPYICFKIKNI